MNVPITVRPLTGALGAASRASTCARSTTRSFAAIQSAFDEHLAAHLPGPGSALPESTWASARASVRTRTCRTFRSSMATRSCSGADRDQPRQGPGRRPELAFGQQLPRRAAARRGDARGRAAGRRRRHRVRQHAAWSTSRCRPALQQRARRPAAVHSATRMFGKASREREVRLEHAREHQRRRRRPRALASGRAHASAHRPQGPVREPASTPSASKAGPRKRARRCWRTSTRSRQARVRAAASTGTRTWCCCGTTASRSTARSSTTSASAARWCARRSRASARPEAGRRSEFHDGDIDHHARSPRLARARSPPGSQRRARCSPPTAPGPTARCQFVNWSNPGGNLDIVGRVLSRPRVAQAGASRSSPTTASAPRASSPPTSSPRRRPTATRCSITSSTGQLTNALTRLKLPFDVRCKDFEPVSLLVAGNIALVARPDAPFNNLKELVAYAKKQRQAADLRQLRHRHQRAPATASGCSVSAGIDLAHVPYKTASSAR